MNADDLISSLMRVLRASRAEVIQLVLSAPYRYKHYQIPKRTGGVRDIYHPAAELKTIQRWLVSNVFSNLPLHDAVCSYRKGVNIRQHAEKHISSNYILRMDFKDFFPSITYRVLDDFFWHHISNGNIECQFEARSILLQLVCRHEERGASKGLSIGAPSSPLISNAVLFDFDVAIHSLCLGLGCVYTRYADDIFISASHPNVLGGLEGEVKRLVAEVLPFLQINENKTVHSSRKNNMSVTGLVLTPQRKISIGRDLKRKIKTEVYLWGEQLLDVDKLLKLRGMVAYVRDVEPDFYDALERKFGSDLMRRLNEGVSSEDDIPF